jgi:peptidoglycan glycosyltransferase
MEAETSVGSAGGALAAVSAAPPVKSEASIPFELLARLPVGPGAFELAEASLEREAGDDLDPAPSRRLTEWLPVPPDRPFLAGPLRVEYSLDAELTRRVFAVMRTARTKRGHVIVLDTNSGRVLAYASSDPEQFPPTRAYPAASLVKIVTAAAALRYAPDQARTPCRYRGSPYRLTRSRLYPPPYGHEISLERSLATSNNQCFAQLAVNAVGPDALLAMIARFGWLEEPAPGHAAGVIVVGNDAYDLGRLGCGLGGGRITPLHAAQLAVSLADGELVQPWWIDRALDGEGRELLLPQRQPGRRIMTPELAAELRHMLVRTTTNGTARSAFRDRSGRPKLGGIRVAGKTGNLSGSDPSGRYEWFIGVAPAEDPTIAISVLQVHGDLWWMKSSEIAADVLRRIFCERGSCSPELAARFTGSLGSAVSPVFLSESGR